MNKFGEKGQIGDGRYDLSYPECTLKTNWRIPSTAQPYDIPPLVHPAKFSSILAGRKDKIFRVNRLLTGWTL